MEERALTVLSVKSICFSSTSKHNDDAGCYIAPLFLVQRTYGLHVKEKWVLQLSGDHPHLTLLPLNLTHIMYKGYTYNV